MPINHNKRSNPGLFKPDTGWAWMVLIGAVLEMIIVMGVMKSGGILLLAYQRRFDASATVASLVSTIQYTVYSLITPIVMTVGIKLSSCRMLVLGGGVLMSMSYVITSLVGDIRWVMVSNGAIQGLGWACVGPTTLAIIGQYFEKRRGLANSIAASGASAGGLMFAPLLTEMLEWYGFSGCMLMLAGIHLNLCVSALLYRPIQPGIEVGEEEKAKLIPENPEKELIELHDDSFSKYDTDLVDKRQNNEHDDSNQADKQHIDNIHDIDMMEKDIEVVGVDEYTDTRKEFTIAVVGVRKEEKEYNEDISAFEIKCLHKTGTSEVEAKHCENNELNKKERENKVGSAVMAFVRFFDFRLFKNPVFVLLQISFALIATGCRLTTIYLVTHAKDLGINKHKIATLITIFSAIDLVGRVLIGVLSDLKLVRASVIIGACACVVAITSFLLQFYTSYWLLIVFCVVLGLVSGSPPALLGPIIVDYMTVRHLPSTLGFSTLTLGLVNALSYYVAGFLRDVYLSYIPTFYFIGGITLAGGCIMFTLPLIEGLKKDEKQQMIKDDSKI